MTASDIGSDGGGEGGDIIMISGATTSGGTGLTDVQRRNILLTGIYTAKCFANPLRQLEQYLDGYKSATGIDSGSSTNYNLDTTNGNVAPSLTSATTTIGSPNSITANSGYTMLTEDTAITNSDTVTSIGVYSTSAVTFVLKIAKRNSAGNYTFVVSETYVHGGTGWEDHTLSSPYTVPGSGTYYVGAYSASNFGPLFLGTGGTGSRAYLSGDQTGGPTGGFTEDLSYVACMRFTSNTGALSNMTLITTAQTADASVATGQILMEVDTAVGVSYGTDLTAEFTCDGGSHWTAGTLATAGTGQAGRTIAETNAIVCTSGTSFAARIKTLTNKNIPIYGLALTAS
jgi:hypothetical protein